MRNLLRSRRRAFAGIAATALTATGVGASLGGTPTRVQSGANSAGTGAAEPGAGVPDLRWGTRGEVVVTLAAPGPGSFRGELDSIVPLPDGKVLVTGAVRKSAPDSGVAAVVRLGEDGRLDGSFGTRGRLEGTELARRFGLPAVEAVAVELLLPGGRVQLAGYSHLRNGVRVRLLRSGALDRSFPRRAFHEVLPRGDDFGEDTFLEAANDGKTTWATYLSDVRGYSLAVFRRNGDGSLDGGFGTRGVGAVRVGQTALLRTGIRLSDGGYVLAGQANGNAVIGGLGSDGRAKVGFGSGGKVEFGNPSGYPSLATGVAELSDGRLMVAGATHLSNRVFLFLARLTADGLVDPTFGRRGIKETTMRGESYLVPARDDRFLLAPSYPARLVRVDADGALDANFGTAGVASVPFMPQPLVVDERGRTLFGTGDRGATGAFLRILRLTG